MLRGEKIFFIGYKRYSSWWAGQYQSAVSDVDTAFFEKSYSALKIYFLGGGLAEA
jgi:hypothetical protein